MSFFQGSFPQYRKYEHNRTYFKISSLVLFEELNIVASNYSCTTFAAKILPDRNFINDMLLNEENQWVVITEQEYNAAKERCENSLQRF